MEPIAYIILVCRKQPLAATNPPPGNPTRQRGSAHTTPTRQRGGAGPTTSPPDISDALASARSKIGRLLAAGFALSRNDRKIIHYGQLLTTLTAARDAAHFASIVNAELDHNERPAPVRRARSQQQVLFEQA